MQYRRFIPTAIAAVMVGAALPEIAMAQTVKRANDLVAIPVGLAGKCDQTLKSKLSSLTQANQKVSGWTSVIIQMQGNLSVEQEKQLSTIGCDLYKRLPIIHAVALQIPTRNLIQLASLPFVTHLSSDAMVGKNDEFTVLHSVADGAYYAYGLTGAGVTIAVLDSGIATHKDLTSVSGASRVLTNVNFTTETTATDLCGHGTHVAGIIAGNGALSTGTGFYRTFYGIARGANLVNVRVLDKQGSGTVSAVVSGLGWVIQNKSKYNIKIVNLSLGKPITESYKTDPLCQAVEAAYRAGITVVCAAGNGGRANLTFKNGDSNEGWGTAYGSIQSPGNDPYVITVGATKQNVINPYNRYVDLVATYSSRGPSRYDYNLKPDIMAPGNQVISLNVPGSYLTNTYSATNRLPLGYYNNSMSSQASGDYFYLSGTSMASPVVAGAVALMLQANPNLSPDTIKARLMVSADKWTGPDGKTDPCTYGAGVLNIPTALNTNITATRPALSPPLQVTKDGKNVLVDPSQILWGPAGTSTGTIWGTENIKGLQIIWGGGISTGSIVVDGKLLNTNYLTTPGTLPTSVVWSDQIIWGGTNLNVDLSTIAIYGEQ